MARLCNSPGATCSFAHTHTHPQKFSPVVSLALRHRSKHPDSHSSDRQGVCAQVVCASQSRRLIQSDDGGRGLLDERSARREMPGAASCQPGAVALAPTRFRASSDPQAPTPEAPVPLGLPPPKPAGKAPGKTPSGPPTPQDAASGSPSRRASDPAPATNRPAGAPTQPEKALTLMELVNAAARQEERQEALVRAGRTWAAYPSSTYPG